MWGDAAAGTEYQGRFKKKRKKTTKNLYIQVSIFPPESFLSI